MSDELPIVQDYVLSHRGQYEENVLAGTLWGLLDWQRAILAHSKEAEMLPPVRTKLTEILNYYSGVITEPFASDALINLGYFDNQDQINQIKAGDYSHETADGQVNLDGLFVIGIVGQIQAGKGTSGKILESDYGSRHYPFIEALYAFGYALGFRPDREDREGLVEINNIIKPRYGNDRFAKSTLLRAQRRAKLNQTEIISCDGFRSQEEAELVLAQPSGYLFSVWAEQQIRYERALRKPQISQRPKNFEAFALQDEKELNGMMKEPLRLSEPPFDNNQRNSHEHLRQQIHTRMDQILHTK